MADILQALQSAGAPESGVDIGRALQFAGDDTPQAPGPAPTPSESLMHGLTEGVIGLGRITQHVMPDAFLNYIRGALGWDPVSTSQWDQIASKREQDYDQARAAAGQTGIDWWRLAGNIANPLNYIAPEGAAASAGGRILQAAGQAGAVSGIQSAAESTTPGGFWWDTAKGASIGAGTGGILGGIVEGIAPAIRWATNQARNLVTPGNVDASSVAADSVVKKALQDSGTDPNSIDLNLLKGMRQDVQSALEHGADISPQAITARARAESLPVPVRLTRGQATGDAMQYARELGLRGVQGVGEPITQRLTEQNGAFIANLDALGAKNALDPVSFGNQAAGKIQSFWDGLQNQKNALYDAVRNSKGQSAAMDGVTAADNIKNALNTFQASYAYNLLPTNIQRTIEEMGTGNTPFNVAQMQSLDKIWGDAARGTDGSTANAINTARRILGEAPIADDTGEAAKQAYFAARQAHAQQMSLVDPKLPNGRPNLNFQPLVKAVVMDGKPPEKLFADHFMNAPSSVGQKNLQFLTGLDPSAPQQVGQTLMGEIKRQALNSSSDERGTISESVIRGWANDPVKSARLDALLPKPAVDTFHNLASTVETAKKFPVAAAVNTSNTGSALVNTGLSMLKGSAAGQILKRLPLAKDIVEGLSAAKTQSEVQSALSPGVTLKSLMTATPSQAMGRRMITRFGIPAAISAEDQRNGPNQ